MKILSLLLFATVISLVFVSSGFAQPVFVKQAFEKATLPADANGKWVVRTDIDIQMPNGEKFSAGAYLEVKGKVLAGNLPLKAFYGSEIPGNTVYINILNDSSFTVRVRHDIGGKPFLGRPAEVAKMENNFRAPYAKGKVIWDSKECDITIYLAPSQQMGGGVQPPAETNSGTFLDNAVIKAATKWTDKGGWYVTATVTIKKRDNSERFQAVGRVIDSGVKVGGFALTGDLPMTVNGLGDAVNSLDFKIRQDGQITMRRLIAHKAFLGRPATTFKGVVNKDHVFAEGMWNGGEILIRVELASDFRKQPPAPIPSAPNETAAEIIAKTPGLIAVNTVFVINKRYWSPNKKHFLVFQGDGNLVIYRTASTGPEPIWNTGTNKPTILAPFPGVKAVFQKDGNLVVYGPNNKAVWDSVSDLKRRNEKGWSDYFDFTIGIDSESPTPYSKTVWLSMQNDGNLVVLRGAKPPDGFVFWHSK